MNIKIIRNMAFHLHRAAGLIAGILLCIAGLTGAVLVFWHEIDHQVITQQFGQVVPAGELVSLGAIAETVRTAFAAKGLTLSSIIPSDHTHHPYSVWMHAPRDRHWQVFVNQYTGQVIGLREWESSWVGRIYSLHYQLFAGGIGTLLMGIVALLTLLLSVTGIVLWPGWRKLVAGFKIKWKNVHIKRFNYDIHKVVGIITAAFLAGIGFTGFAWNIPQAKVTEAIYAVTQTPKPADPVSRPNSSQQPLPIAELVQRAQAEIPDATITYVSFPEEPEQPFTMGKRQAQETYKWGNTRIYLDQFTGEVIRLSDGLKASHAEVILSQFGPLHFGTFWGISSRILYVFVGLSPTVLMVTGVVMWWYRRRKQPKSTGA